MAQKISIVDKDGNPVELEYATEQSAGFDIPIDLGVGNSTVILPTHKPQVIPTGLYLKVEGEPEDGKVLALQILPRSSTALQGLVIANSPGLIDADYPKEIMLIVGTLEKVRSTVVFHGDKLAQGVFVEVLRPDCVKVSDEKRTGGLGSTTKKPTTKKGKK